MLFSSSLAGSFFPNFFHVSFSDHLEHRLFPGAHVVQVFISPSSTTQIVDSVIALFRVDFTRRGELAELQQKPDQMLSRLTKIAEEFNVSVYNDKPRF
ncbi:hypothetical protein L6452_18112 [Arctium lappa]|uniref:Uncharacterized protein n=1 Tax=Arctium lappa TaxID=4217 RepID=A0ACB9C5L1_ARCLA|nr:hypothetical protein L6452_18112 [Arctium lappa]